MSTDCGKIGFLKGKKMKKLIVLALVVISLCSMAAVTVTTNGPKPSKEHDVFVARYVPEFGHTIEDVYFHGDLQPFARIDKGTYWVFLFDAVFDGKFHGTEALISNVGYSDYRLCPYWPKQYSSTAGSWIGIDKGTYWVFLFDAVFDGESHGTEALISDIGYSVYRICWPKQYSSTAGSCIGEVAGKTGFMAHPVDGSGPTCFGWKSLDVVTNYYPVISRKTGASLVVGDLTPVADDVPKGAIMCYGIIQTNINVRLDAKWE